MDPKLSRVATQPDSDWDDDETLERLYRRHAPWLGAMLRRRFGRGIEAETEDLVQETYARLAPRDAANFERPRALLMRVAVNLAKDLMRRRAVRGRHAEEVQSAPAREVALSNPLDDLFLKETILSIPKAYRDVFVLSRFDGLTYEEIATRCGLSVKSVEWRLSKAVSHCLKRIQD